MPSHPHPVVLLSVHALLGQGIARYLLTEAGVEVAVVSAVDRAAILAALSGDPRVLIYERSSVVDSLDLGALAPHAVLIDVSAAVASGAPVIPEPSGPAAVETILSAVHRA